MIAQNIEGVCKLAFFGRYLTLFRKQCKIWSYL